jgi:hypothetical protein
MILGIGALAANIVCPWLLGTVFTDKATTPPTVHYHELFLIPTICAIVAAIALAVFFHPPKKATEEAGELAEATV